MAQPPPARVQTSLFKLKKAKAADVEKALKSIGAVVTLAQGQPDGFFVPYSSEPNIPKWLPPIREILIDPTVAVQSQVAGGLLLVNRNADTYVFSFGHAFVLLRNEWLVANFGRTAVLSIVPRDQVLEVTAEQLLAKQHTAQDRAPRPSSVNDFQFEGDRDLVAAVGGSPAAQDLALFGGKVSGGTSFRFGLLVSRLIESLETVEARYSSGDHRKTWPEANNFELVVDKSIVNELESQLDKVLLGSGATDKIALYAPSQSRGEARLPTTFAIGRMRSPPVTSPLLYFASWVSHVLKNKEPVAVSTAKSTLVHLFDENAKEIARCSMFECFATEMSQDNKTYVLSGGEWYEAARQFVRKTNDLLKSIEQPAQLLPMWNNIDKEGLYNESVCTDRKFWLFDKLLLHMGGNQSKFEFCDVMHFPTKTLYFVKQPGSSASISHLLEQTRRTAELFFSPDQTFRVALRKRLSTSRPKWDISWLDSRPLRHEWSLCLVLMGRELADLPFFAKCGLARFLRECQQSGYELFAQRV